MTGTGTVFTGSARVSGCVLLHHSFAPSIWIFVIVVLAGVGGVKCNTVDISVPVTGATAEGMVVISLCWSVS